MYQVIFDHGDHAETMGVFADYLEAFCYAQKLCVQSGGEEFIVTKVRF